MNYIKIKRNKTDRCNICGKITELTWDHVPPKSVLSVPNLYVNTMFSEMGMPSSELHMVHYQSGIKYRDHAERQEQHNCHRASIHGKQG